MSNNNRFQKKKLGQVFLNQPNTIRKIVDDLELTGAETALEIGGGDGRVSEIILPKVSKLIIVEIDERFVSVLEKRFGQYPHVHIVSGSILADKTLEQILVHAGDEKLVVYGSIPYYITTPILKWVIANHRHIARASLLMQREVAERAVATPGNKDYGYLSVFLQLQAFVYPGVLVKRSCFKPIPKVDSRVLNLIPKPEMIAAQPKQFWQFVSILFSQRRKQLRNLVKQFCHKKPGAEVESALMEKGISLNDRPENYAPNQLELMFNIIQSC